MSAYSWNTSRTAETLHGRETADGRCYFNHRWGIISGCTYFMRCSCAALDAGQRAQLCGHVSLPVDK
jgi:hypothetical protein